jgi:hypothetical protein
MSAPELIDYEQAYEHLELMYLRLLHEHEKLKRDHEHARAAIANDLLIEQLQQDFKLLF